MSNTNAPTRITISIKENVTINELNDEAGKLEIKKKPKSKKNEKNDAKWKKANTEKKKRPKSKSKQKKNKKENIFEPVQIPAEMLEDPFENKPPLDTEKEYNELENRFYKKLNRFIGSEPQSSDADKDKSKKETIEDPDVANSSNQDKTQNPPITKIGRKKSLHDSSNYKDTFAQNTSYIHSASSDVGSMGEFEKKDDKDIDLNNQPDDKEIENLIYRKRIRRITTGGRSNAIKKIDKEKDVSQKSVSNENVPSSPSSMIGCSIPMADFGTDNDETVTNEISVESDNDRPPGFDEYEDLDE